MYRLGNNGLRERDTAGRCVTSIHLQAERQKSSQVTILSDPFNDDVYKDAPLYNR